MGADHRRFFRGARITLAAGRIHPLPDYVRAVLTVLYALRLDSVRGWTIRAGAVSRVRFWRDGKKVSGESDDLQRLGLAVLDLRSADGRDQHELRKHGTQQRQLCWRLQRRNWLAAARSRE